MRSLPCREWFLKWMKNCLKKGRRKVGIKYYFFDLSVRIKVWDKDENFPKRFARKKSPNYNKNILLPISGRFFVAKNTLTKRNPNTKFIEESREKFFYTYMNWSLSLSLSLSLLNLNIQTSETICESGILRTLNSFQKRSVIRWRITWKCSSNLPLSSRKKENIEMV